METDIAIVEETFQVEMWKNEERTKSPSTLMNLYLLFSF